MPFTSRPAKYPGRCSNCGGPVLVGDPVFWSKDTGVRHAECPDERSPDIALGTIRLSSTRRGSRGWRLGQVILSDEFSRRHGAPDGLVIVACSSQPGDAGGLAYTAWARPATPAEIAQAVEALIEPALAQNRCLRSPA